MFREIKYLGICFSSTFSAILLVFFPDLFAQRWGNRESVIKFIYWGDTNKAEQQQQIRHSCPT